MNYFVLATTAVYHEIRLRKELYVKRLTFYGSLTDEAWILNLLYQMTNFPEAYSITTWNKSIKNPFPFHRKTTHTTVVLNSPNLLKCKKINDYIDSRRHVKNDTLCLVKIAPTERRYFSHFVDSYIDAIGMTYEELADKIFSSGESK